MSEQKITKILYDYKLEEFVKRLEELQNPSVYYVSDLIYCPWKRYFRLRFPYLTFTFEPLAVMGELVHKGLQGILVEKGFQPEYEVSRTIRVNNEEVIIKGRIDAYKPGELVEIKTSRGSTDSLPYPHHLLQVKLYMELTNVEKATLIYVSSDKIIEYDVKLDEPVLEKLLQETMNLSVAPRWDWECRSCVFYKICPHRINK